MRRAKDCWGGGLIFNALSLAGLCAIPGHAYYQADKFIVEDVSGSVTFENSPHMTYVR
jgi:short-subunit dehydrogenase